MALIKTKIANIFTWPWRHKVISLFALLVLIIAGYFIYEQVALEINKHDFQQARATVDSVYTDIVKQVGEPDDSKRISDCTRSYQELEGYGPPITCNIDERFIYSVDNKAKASVIFKEIQKIIDSTMLMKRTSMPATSISDDLVINTYYHSASDKYEVHGLRCVVNYVFDTPREIDLNINDSSKKPFEVTIGCYGLARSPYFPLAN